MPGLVQPPPMNQNPMTTFPQVPYQNVPTMPEPGPPPMTQNDYAPFGVPRTATSRPGTQAGTMSMT